MVDRRRTQPRTFVNLPSLSPLSLFRQVLIPPADPSSSSADADAVPRSNFTFEFDAERRAVESAAGPSSLPSPSEWTPPDPWSGLFEQLLLLQMPPPGRGQGQGAGEPSSSPSSSSREEVALAAAAAAALAKAAAESAGSEEESSASSTSSLVAETKRTLEPLRQLSQMGFDPRRSLGALVVSRGDLAAATDACLAAAAASGARI